MKPTLRIFAAAALLLFCSAEAYGAPALPAGIARAIAPPAAPTGIAFRPAMQVVPCAGGAGSHCINWSWTAPNGSCPTCTYNLLEGSTAGGESSTPINTAPITGTTFQQPMTLEAAAQTVFAKVQAVETTGSLVQTANSTEVSVTFPALLIGPTNLVPSPE